MNTPTEGLDRPYPAISDAAFASARSALPAWPSPRKARATARQFCAEVGFSVG